MFWKLFISSSSQILNPARGSINGNVYFELEVPWWEGSRLNPPKGSRRNSDCGQSSETPPLIANPAKSKNPVPKCGTVNSILLNPLSPQGPDLGLKFRKGGGIAFGEDFGTLSAIGVSTASLMHHNAS